MCAFESQTEKEKQKLRLCYRHTKKREKKKKKKREEKKWRKISTNASACPYLVHHYMAAGTKLTLTTDSQKRKH